MMPSTELTVVFEFFAGSTLVLLYLLRGLGEIAWKRLEYVIVLLAATGLIPATIESRHWLQTDELKWRGEIVDMNAKWIREYFDGTQTYLCGSAPDHSTSEKISAADKEAICKWLNDNRENFAGQGQSRRPLEPQLMQSLPVTTSRFSRDAKALVDRYNSNLEILTSLEKRAKEINTLENVNSGFDALSKAFGAYFLAIALALKIAQIHSDIKRKKIANAKVSTDK